MKLWRAQENETLEDGIFQGMCFTEKKEDAEAYQDNPGFGGKNLLSVEIEDSRILNLGDIEELVDNLNESFIDEFFENNGRVPEYIDENWFWENVDLDEKKRQYVESLQDESWYLWDAWERNPEIIEDLGKNYDWVVYEDNFPDGCITYMAARDIKI